MLRGENHHSEKQASLTNKGLKLVEGSRNAGRGQSRSHLTVAPKRLRLQPVGRPQKKSLSRDVIIMGPAVLKLTVANNCRQIWNSGNPTSKGIHTGCGFE